jgi:hypothetical protein
MYAKAAAHGDAYAQNNLGICYNNGERVDKDFAMPFRIDQASWWYLPPCQHRCESSQTCEKHVQINRGKDG